MPAEAIVSPAQAHAPAPEAVHRFSRSAPRLSGVIAELTYLAPTMERPYNYMYEPPAGMPRENCEYQGRQMWITDARAIASPLSVHVRLSLRNPSLVPTGPIFSTIRFVGARPGGRR
jgi:hypothetical protein